MSGFLKDTRGRVPFAVLGVFLLVGSAVTSTVVINLENTISEETGTSLGVGTVSNMLSFMEADLSTTLNYAGMKAMKFAGQHPVTKPNTGSAVAEDYNGGSWDNVNADNGWDAESDRLAFNKNWIKNMTRVNLNPYLQGNYMDGAYNNGGYEINVIDARPEEDGGPIHRWRAIDIEDVTMNLDRQDTSPVPSVPSDIRSHFVVHGDNNMPSYWEFSLHLIVEIKKVEGEEPIGRRNITVSTLVNSRMPLLQELTTSYEKCLTGGGNILDNKLFILTTLLSELYTEGRALAQYAGMYERIPNIVDNRWLQYIVNGVLLLEEFMVFNSIDPAAAMYLLVNAGDLAATGFPEQEQLTNQAQDLFESAEAADIQNIFGEPSQDLLNTISNESSVQNSASEAITSPDSYAEVNITTLAEDILYNTSYRYYYYNETDDGSYIEYTSDTFLGYNATIEGDQCFYMHPPPYYYYNQTYYNQNGHNLSLDEYHGESLEDGEMSFNYTLTYNNTISSHTSSVSREVSNRLNEGVSNEIENKIDDTYKAAFQTTTRRHETVSPHYEPAKGSYWDCRKGGDDTWQFGGASNITSQLEEGNSIVHFPYSEIWEVTWYQDHTYGHNTPQYVDGEFAGYDCEGSETFRYIKKERVNFTIKGWDYVDVDGSFSQININFGNGQRRDDNLYNISRDYIKDYFLNSSFSNSRNKVLQSEREGIVDSRNIPANDDVDNPYGMDWLRGYGGEVELALREILEQIKEDNITANVSHDEFRDRGFNDTIDNQTGQLLDRYRPHMSAYKNDGAYRNGSSGNYMSCGARVIAKMRDWYVDEIEQRLEESAQTAKDSLTENISDELEQHGVETGLGDREEAQSIGVEPTDLPSLQFGLTMPLTRDDGDIQWDEEVGFSIDQDPDYFNRDDASEDTYRFLVKNICLFGPSGLPILPTPVTPWVITVNCWYIHLEGQFTKFEVVDTVGEMQPNALFGDTDHSYKRWLYHVEDPCSNRRIGDTAPISFTVDTVNVAVVPPGFIGDINPTSYSTEVAGEGEPLSD